MISAFSRSVHKQLSKSFLLYSSESPAEVVEWEASVLGLTSLCWLILGFKMCDHSHFPAQCHFLLVRYVKHWLWRQTCPQENGLRHTGHGQCCGGQCVWPRADSPLLLKKLCPHLKKNKKILHKQNFRQMNLCWAWGVGGRVWCGSCVKWKKALFFIFKI